MPIKLQKRNLLQALELHGDGDEFTIIGLRESQSEFFKYDLCLKNKEGSSRILGLQAQSFNMDSLIELYGDNPEKWAGKKLVLYQSEWNNRPVIRVHPSSKK